MRLLGWLTKILIILVNDIQEPHSIDSNASGLEEGGNDRAPMWYATNLYDVMIVKDNMDFHDMLEALFKEGGDSRHSRVVNNENSDGLMPVDFTDKFCLVEVVAKHDKLGEWLENRYNVKSHGRG